MFLFFHPFSVTLRCIKFLYHHFNGNTLNAFMIVRNNTVHFKLNIHPMSDIHRILRQSCVTCCGHPSKGGSCSLWFNLQDHDGDSTITLVPMQSFKLSMKQATKPWSPTPASKIVKCCGHPSKDLSCSLWFNS